MKLALVLAPWVAGLDLRGAVVGVPKISNVPFAGMADTYEDVAAVNVTSRNVTVPVNTTNATVAAAPNATAAANASNMTFEAAPESVTVTVSSNQTATKQRTGPRRGQRGPSRRPQPDSVPATVHVAPTPVVTSEASNATGNRTKAAVAVASNGTKPHNVTASKPATISAPAEVARAAPAANGTVAKAATAAQPAPAVVKAKAAEAPAVKADEKAKAPKAQAPKAAPKIDAAVAKATAVAPAQAKAVKAAATPAPKPAAQPTQKAAAPATPAVQAKPAAPMKLKVVSHAVVAPTLSPVERAAKEFYDASRKNGFPVHHHHASSFPGFS
mmetsp:Transcript_53394/g.117232  ORF Transcript_53394/g.117232 Transcript_53394/m.117232 type:complete len:328 (+) Transcript_53394:84-1067(+)